MGRQKYGWFQRAGIDMTFRGGRRQFIQSKMCLYEVETLSVSIRCCAGNCQGTTTPSRRFTRYPAVGFGLTVVNKSIKRFLTYVENA
jgi:hypothetical protein